MLGNQLRKSSVRFNLLFLALLLSSCSRVRMTGPLSDPDKAKPDERLYGAWKVSEKDANEDKEDIFYLFIGKVGWPGVPSGIMKAVAIGWDSENNIDDTPWYFFTSSTGDNNYANYFEEDEFKRAKSPAWDKRRLRSFGLLKYKVKGDNLVVWLQGNDDAVEAAVRKGQVKGTIEEEGEGSLKRKIVSLTDGQDLLRFLKKGGDKVIFNEDKLVFFRVK